MRWAASGSCRVFEAYLELASGLTTTILARGCEVFPEEGVVDVAATMEVEEGSDLRGRRGITLALCLGDRLEGAVEAVDVGLVVLAVVELHDLARDERLESAIVVCCIG